ncbi:MAG: heparinase II/III family protein [Eubacteriales bacterium]
MYRMFQANQVTAEGKVLPLPAFRLFADMAQPDILPEKAAHLLADAEAVLRQDIPLLPATTHMRFERDGDRSQFERLFFTRRHMLYVLTLAEHLEHQGRFLDKLIDVLWAILEESAWGVPAHNVLNPSDNGQRSPLPLAYGEHPHHVDLFSAGTAACLAFCYHLHKDSLDSAAKVINRRLLWALEDRIFTPYLTQNAWWTGLSPKSISVVNNWNPWITSNVLTAAALTVSDLNLREALVSRAMLILDNYTASLPSDGGCDEGPVYWTKAAASLFDCLEVLYDMSGGAIDVFADPLLRKMGEFVAKANIHGRYYVNFADASPVLSPSGAMIHRFGARTANPVLEAFGDHQALTPAKDSYHKNMYRYVKDLFTRTPAEAPPVCIRQAWLPELKWMIFHEYTDTSRGLFLAMKGGHNAENHNHNDVGNFIVYADGAPLLIDSGADTYTKQTFSEERYTLWYMQSSYHNLPDINGVAQRVGRQYVSTDEVYDEASGGLSLELKQAYPAEAAIRSYRRTAVLREGRVTLTEQLSLEKASPVVFNFLCYLPPQPAQGKVSFANGRSIIFDPSLVPTVETIQLIPGNNLANNWGTDRLYRLSLSAKDVAEKTFTFLIG